MLPSLFLTAAMAGLLRYLRSERFAKLLDMLMTAWVLRRIGVTKTEVRKWALRQANRPPSD